MQLTKRERDRFNLILNGYAFFQALAAACDFELFSHLSKRPRQTLDEVAKRLKIPIHSARILLLSCCALGLVKRESKTGVYSNAPLSEKLLVSGSPESLVPFVKLGQAVQEPGCRFFAESLKAGTNAGLKAFPGDGRTLYERMAGRPDVEKLFHDGMSQFTKQTNEAVGGLREMARVRHLLDVGGGKGTNAILLHQTHPHLEITIFDIDSVCRIAEKAVRREKLSKHIHTFAGDAFVDSFPGNIDAILFSHFLEIFSAQKIQSLYKKAYAALPSKGKMIVWTLCCEDDETGTLQSAKSSIYFLSVASGEGMTYPASDHETWMRDVGFSKVKRYRRPEHALIVATK